VLCHRKSTIFSAQLPAHWQAFGESAARVHPRPLSPGQPMEQLLFASSSMASEAQSARWNRAKDGKTTSSYRRVRYVASMLFRCKIEVSYDSVFGILNRVSDSIGIPRHRIQHRKPNNCGNDCDNRIGQVVAIRRWPFLCIFVSR